MYLIPRDSVKYEIVFISYVVRYFVIPLLGNKGRLPIDPPKEKGKL